MKTIKTTCFISLLLSYLFLFPGTVGAQMTISKARNAVKTTIPTEPVTSVSAITENNSITTIQYSDGLGRANISVGKKVTPSGKDLVSMVAYDAQGNIGESWLPTAMNSAPTLPNPSQFMTDSRAFHNDTHPYSKKTLHSSDGFKMATSVSPGQDWHLNQKKKSVLILPSGDPSNPDTDLSTLAVYFTSDGNGVKRNGYYPAAALKMSYYIDEDDKEKIAFYNPEGQLILERQIYDYKKNVFYDTYYIYNQKGLLCYVLSPEASKRMTSDSTIYIESGINTENNPIDQFSYVYKYTDMNLCNKKKLPGADWIYYVYDVAGRLILSQDGIQREKKEWSFNIYDQYSRIIMQGDFLQTSSFSDFFGLMEAFNSYTSRVESWTSDGYTLSNQKFKSHGSMLITKTYYYDTYDFINLPTYSSLKSRLVYTTANRYGNRGRRIQNGVDVLTKGMITGTETKLLDGSGSTVEAYYYDDKGRLVRTNISNHLDAPGYKECAYNFNNTISKEYSYQSIPGLSLAPRVEYIYSYDKLGRLLSKDQNPMGNSTLSARIDSLEYDELGRIKRKLLHKAAYPISYTYNIRNQLTGISSSLFKQNLAYQDGTGKKYYNGNVASVSEEINIAPAIKHHFISNLSYDAVNRLSASDITSSTGATSNPYSSHYRYDSNGNITYITRKGTIVDYSDETEYFYEDKIDQLNMSYSGNQLIKVVDESQPEWSNTVGNTDFTQRNPLPAAGANHYLYDKNGNLKADHHKNIAWIQYNSLNLPSKIQMGNGDKTEYLYDASGVKRRAKYSIAINPMQIPLGKEDRENTNNLRTTKTRDYIAEFIFEGKKTTRILMPDGYINASMSSNPDLWKRVYQIKDHLGNVRVEIESDKLSNSTQNSDYRFRSSSIYYPFGMEMSFQGKSNSTLPYRMSGNEVERTNTDWHDFHHRWYDQQLGRFLTMDPLAELDYSISPYAYCNNNPINLIDPWGLTPKGTGTPVIGGSGTEEDPYDLEAPEIKGERPARPKDSWFYITHTLPGSNADNVAEERYLPGPSREYILAQAEKNHQEMMRKENISAGEFLLDVTGMMNDEYGGIGAGLKKIKGSFSLKNGFEHFPKGKGGFNPVLQRKTYNSLKVGKALGRGTTIVSVIIGSFEIYNGYKADGDKVGYNTVRAAAGVVGGIAGGIGGTQAGATIGAFVGPFGAIVGGAVGGVAGGRIGAFGGETLVDKFY